MLKRLINIGVSKSMTRQKVRSVKLTNITSLTIIFLGILFFIPVVYENGWNLTANLDLAAIVLVGCTFWLNSKGYLNISRIVISVFPSFLIISASILEKLNQPENVVVYDYFDARIIIMGLFIIPFFLFSYREKALLLSVLSLPIILVLGFDPIHNLFGVGFVNFFGAMPKAYIVSGIYIDIVLLFGSWSVYYFKANIERLLQKNISLSEDLGEKNIELSGLFEELEKSNEDLRKNELVIRDQKFQLEKSNIILAEEVENKTNELKQSNEELIKHNNELEQFSNTLSHNLRGPVANLLGLSQLFKMDKDEDNRDSISNHIYKSAEALDGVIKDLNKIVELRNNLFQIKERIEIENEVNDIWLTLESSVAQCSGKISMNIITPITYGVRSYFHSILYNLISNAIKYRHPERDCLVTITSTNVDNECEIKVQDNGIGVDLEKYGDKMFGMYKRFHTHLEGKSVV